MHFKTILKVLNDPLALLTRDYPADFLLKKKNLLVT